MLFRFGYFGRIDIDLGVWIKFDFLRNLGKNALVWDIRVKLGIGFLFYFLSFLFLSLNVGIGVCLLGGSVSF